ncbi:NAD(P)H-hydrate dehydratase [Desulfovibrio sp. ZJ369]|uniref:NAD(P)H-hydrate dehydratase n=1 Tax=Desulfovibrio sp. ZJ369 TaxID=2709793 RepID=UPI0013EC3049|nr:NAD(P)H-hydrate dehydratase [Desulfovibrio sp. ZJ369]
MWLITGTLPDPDFAIHPDAVQARSRVESNALILPDGRAVPVQRGTAALAATALLACEAYGFPLPGLLLAGDTGQGTGSRRIYAWLVTHLAKLAPAGLTFHYLFPDLDWHNRVLMALQALERKPMLAADAGFMYVAKMSGYADAYDLFTPDLGELAFLADEKAPHPFYTRGFLLAEEDNVPELLQRARRHGNCPSHMIVKGSTDYIVCNGEIAARVSQPSVPAMECIGGTGDLVTGLATAFLAGGVPLCRAAEAAARAARLLAWECAPTPSTQVGELIRRLPPVLRARKKEILGDSA